MLCFPEILPVSIILFFWARIALKNFCHKGALKSALEHGRAPMSYKSTFYDFEQIIGRSPKIDLEQGEIKPVRS